MVVGRFARLDPMKGWDVLVDALALIRLRRDDVHVVAAGGAAGTSPEQLRARVAAAGCADRFLLLDQLEDTTDALAACDVTTSPSLFGEGFRTSWPSRWRLACCASPATSVTSALVVGDASLLVEAGDAPGLARKLVAVLSLPADERAVRGHGRPAATTTTPGPSARWSRPPSRPWGPDDGGGAHHLGTRDRRGGDGDVSAHPDDGPGTGSGRLSSPSATTGPSATSFEPTAWPL